MKNTNNASTIISCHLTAMKVADYCLTGWRHSLVVLHKQTRLTFANFSKESRVTFIQFFSLIKILAFCSQLPNIQACVCAFDCILLLLFLVSVCISSPEISCNLTANLFLKQKQICIFVFSVVLVALLHHPFLLLYHY